MKSSKNIEIKHETWAGRKPGEVFFTTAEDKLVTAYHSRSECPYKIATERHIAFPLNNSKDETVTGHRLVKVTILNQLR